MSFLSIQWGKLPAWMRKTIVHTVELVLIGILSYLLSVVSGEKTWDFNVITVIVLTTISKALRSHPEIPVNDYVNNQPPKQ
jgi:hypothetical protein